MGMGDKKEGMRIKEGNIRNMSSKHTVLCGVVAMCGTVITNVGFV